VRRKSWDESGRRAGAMRQLAATERAQGINTPASREQTRRQEIFRSRAMGEERERERERESATRNSSGVAHKLRSLKS
jgi:hypothetical protein